MRYLLFSIALLLIIMYTFICISVYTTTLSLGVPMKSNKKLCLLIILILVFTAALFACEQPPEVVTLTFTVDGRVHREYIIGHGEGLVDVPEVPKKQGYIASWSVSDFSEIYKDTTATAIYTKNFFKVTFKAENLILGTRDVTIGSNPSSMPVIPPKTGYTSSWSITDFTAYTMDTVVMAVYSPIMLDVTFQSEGAVDIIKQVAYGSDFTDFPPIPSIEGKRGEWMLHTTVADEDVWSDADFTTVTQSITVKARYLPQIIKITFNDEGILTNELLEHKQQLTLPTDLTKENKIFGGWYLDDEFDQKAVNAEVTEDITLYAFWITINSADAAREDLFVFKPISGGYEIAAAEDAALPDDLILPNSYNGEPITKITNGAFKNTAIKTVLLPVGITEIGTEAFSGCLQLTDADFADKNRLEAIGDYAFYGASKLSAISIAKTIKSIGAFAFSDCSELSAANIPQSSALETIGERAFFGTSITELNISANIIEIGAFAFANLYNIIFNFEGLQNLEKVGRYAFLNCTKLVSFNPQNILSIGDGAFAGCAALSSLTIIGDTPINDYFGDEAFVGTAGSYLVSQTIKQRNAQGEYVLDGGQNVYIISSRRLPTSLNTITIREGCVDIAANLLNNCVSVHNINIPASAQTIGRLAFAAEQGDGNNLMKPGILNIAEGSMLKEIEESAFLMRTTFNEITFPAGVTSIGNQAFRQATNLTSINFANADTLEYIGESAFAGSDWMLRRPNGVVYLAGFALTYKGATLVNDIDLTEWAAGTKAIAPFAFSNIQNLGNVNISSDIKTIFQSAFLSCGGITSIIIEEGVESIKDDAFRDCENLVSFVLPQSAKDIGLNILSGCRKLASLTVFGDRATGEFFGQETYIGAYSAVQTPLKNLEFTVTVDIQFFVKWTETKDLYGNYPNSYNITSKYAYNSQGKSLDGAVLTSVSHDLSDESFYEKDANGVYNFTMNFAKGSTASDRTAYTSAFGNTFYINKDMALEDALKVTAQFSETYYIPSTLKKITLKSGALTDREIAPFAFMNITSLQELVLPEGLSSIGEGAFLNCISLGSKNEDGSIISLPIQLPSSLLHIGRQAFKDTQNLLEITYADSTKLETIGASAFENSGLTSFFVADTVREIATSAFSASSVEILQFQNSAVIIDDERVQNPLYIGDFAFSGCNQLMNIIIPDRTISIGDSAFAHNAKLGAVTFGTQSRLSHLGEGAFAHNVLLTSISLPAELDLDALAGVFDGDGALSQLTLYNTNADPHTATLGMLFGTQSFGGSYSAVQNGAVYYIPRALTTIKFLGGKISDYMFQNATEIKMAELSDITGIGVSAFENCTGIEKIDLPLTTGTIGDNAFSGCSSLTAFNFADGSLLSQIGAGAFAASALNNFYFPASVTRIEPYTFFSCTALENIVINSITYIGEYAFYDCATLNMLDLSEQLEYIGDSAFYNCADAEIPFVRLTNLLYVGNFAFYNCLGLTALNAENLQTAGIKAFSGAYNLQEVTIPGNTTLGAVFGSAYYENSYEISQNGTYYLPLALTRARISAATTSIASSAFKGATTLNDIIFHGATPPVLGGAAFEDTSATLKLFVPVASKQAYLDSFAAFAAQIYTHPTDYEEFDFVSAEGGYLVKAKADAQYSGVLYIPAEFNNLPVIGIAATAFSGNADITEVIIPAGIKTIGQAAFKNCVNLEKALFEGGSILEVVGADAFYGSAKLERIFIPKTVREIGDYAFAGTRTPVDGGYTYSSMLSQVDFENDSVLERIGKYAFYLTISLKNIVIPSSVTQMGVAVFRDSGIEHVVFDEMSLLTNIADESFSGSSLISIDLPLGVTHIGKYAFQDCISLTNASLGIRLESIEQRAFYNAKALASLTFPDTLTNIANESFRFCSALERITLSENIEYLGDYAFAGATGLYEVIWREQSIGHIGEYAFMDTPWLAQTQAAEGEGVIYLNNVAYSYKGVMPADTVITLREGTVGISPRAFEGSVGLKGVIIPATVKTIGERAFYGCSLESLIFEEGSQIQSVGNRAFEGAAFASLNLPEGLQSIGNYAFAANAALTSLTLPESLLTIGEGAFSDLPIIDMELVLPQALTAIGAYAFKNSAFSLTIAPESPLTYIGNQAFSNTVQLIVTVPAGITKLNDAFSLTKMTEIFIPEWVTEISAGAFKNSQISNISIAPENTLVRIGKEAFYGLSGTIFEMIGLTEVKEIGEKAFFGCDELKSLVADSVSSIGASAFEGCTKLVEISTNGKALAPLFGGTVPNTLTKINIAAGTTTIIESAFEDADSIVSVYLSATLKTISRYAFKNAKNLETITFEIQETLTTVGKDAFLGTKWLNDKQSGVVYLGKIAYSHKGSGTSAALPAGTTSIAEYAFTDNTILTSISLPATVTTIGEMAFSGCSAVSSFSIASGSALMTIGLRAFYGCSSLTDIAIPLGVQNIAEEAFAGCSAMVGLNYNGIKTLGYLFGTTPYADSYAAVQNGIEYYLPLSLKNIRIMDNSTKIVAYALQNATEVLTVIVSISVKEIGAYAFDGCTGLTQLTIIRGSGLEKIGDAAFRNCAKLTTLYLPSSAKEIGSRILNGASALVELTVGGHTLASLFGTDSYTNSYQIEYQETAYYLPLSLKTVIIADGSVSIAPYAYASTQVESVTLPSSLERIGEYAFYGANSLLNIVQPQQSLLKEIKQYAFANCTSLAAIIISTAMENIGEYAFYNCSALVTVDFLSDYCQIGYNAFQNSQWYTAQSGLIYAGTTLMGYSGQVPEGYQLIVADGTTDIAANAFDSQGQLVSVSLPSSVKTIGNAAFKNCISLEEVVFVGTSLLEEIGSQMFYNCQVLAPFEIPATLKKIGSQAFQNCFAFDAITFGANSSLTEIGDLAFGKSGAVSAQLPSGLKKIGNEAFSDCISLTTINFDNAAVLEYIGGKAFSNAKNAVFNKDVFDNLAHIGAEAFYGCEKLIAVQAPNLAFIGADAFRNCIALTAITLTDEVRIFDLFGDADNDVTATKYQLITFEEQNYNIPVSLVSGYYPNGSTTVKDKAFFGFIYIQKVFLSETVTGIGVSAFEGCTALEAVTGGALQSIGERAFKDSGLQTFELPATIRTIEAYAFEDCSGLKTLALAPGSELATIGDGAFLNAVNAEFTLTEIKKPLTVGVSAFKNCFGLSSFIAPNVISYGDWTFEGCKNLVSLTVTTDYFIGRVFGSAVFEGGYAVTSGGVDYYIPLNLTDIYVSHFMNTVADSAFAGLNSLTSVSLNGVSSIGSRAFSGNTALAAISIPASVVIIYDYAFEGCINLALVNLELSDTLTYIGEGAFDDTSWYGAMTQDMTGTVYIGKVAYANIDAISGTLTLREDTIGISPKAFINQTSITEIRLPLTLSAIGAGAFQNCIAVETVYTVGNFSIGRLFGEQNYGLSYPAIQNGTTYYIPQSLKSVNIISGSTQLASEAFGGCYTLTNITLPTTLYNIGAQSLKGCYGLTAITAPSSIVLGTLFGIVSYANSYAAVQNGITYYVPSSLRTLNALGSKISAHAYQNVSSVTSLNIPLSVTQIGAYALAGCSGLSEISLHNNITRIDEYAMAGCSGITALTLPSGATVGAGALSGFSLLASLTTKGNAPLHNLFGTVAYDGSYQVRQANKYFYIPSTLISITIKDTTVVADSLIEGFSAVSTLALPNNITKIGAYAFYGLQVLNEIALPATLTEVGDFAFYDNRRTVFAFAANNIQKVGAGAFQNCYKLTTFASSSIVSIGDAAFGGCSELVSLGVRTGNVIGKYFGQQMFVDVYPATQQTGALPILYYLPNSLTTITVYGGGGLTEHMFANMTKLKTITLLGEVSIPATAFIGCTGVTTLVGADIVYIEKDALLPLPWLNSYIAARPNNTLVYIGRVAYRFKGIMDIGANLSFNENTTQIYDGAFANQTKLIRVNISANIRYIDISAFEGCLAMNYITVDETNAYFSSQNGILYNKAGDTLIYRPLAMA